jgi:hypothetical protein
MDDQEPPINAMLRRNALDKAISAYVAISAHHILDINESHSDLILIVADKFYQFLKGDTE